MTTKIPQMSRFLTGYYFSRACGNLQDMDMLKNLDEDAADGHENTDSSLFLVSFQFSNDVIAGSEKVDQMALVAARPLRENSHNF